MPERMRWTWPLRGLGLVLVAAVTTVVVLGVQEPEKGAPRAEPSRADREAALLADADYPREYDVERQSYDGLSDALDRDDEPPALDHPACADVGDLAPAFPAELAGVSAAADVPPGPYEEANWDGVDYVESIGPARGADWDPRRAAATVDGCGMARTRGGEYTVTMRPLDPPRPGAVVTRVSLRAANGAYEMAVAVVPVGSQLVVLLAHTFGDFDDGMFTGLVGAAVEKAAAHLE
jgi:hypothetical protein